MSKTLPSLDDELITWIVSQPVFFVATAPDGPGGHVNLSPKGQDTFRVLDPLRVAYLDLTGSGAETIAHLLQNGRIVVMFTAFAGPPRIVRMHGQGIVHVRDSIGYQAHRQRFDDMVGARAIIEIEIERHRDPGDGDLEWRNLKRRHQVEAPIAHQPADERKLLLVQDANIGGDQDTGCRLRTAWQVDRTHRVGEATLASRRRDAAVVRPKLPPA